MKIRSIALRVGLALIIGWVPLVAHAETVSVPQLLVREIKITGDEFVVLQATANIPDLSAYWVGYSSTDTANPGAVVPTQQLPAYALDAGQAVLMTSDGAEICDAVLTTKLSVALSDTKGTLVVRQLESSGMTSTFVTVDTVNWAKPSTTGTTAALLDLRKEAGLSYPVWYHDPSFVKSWRVGNLAGCALALAAQSNGLAAETVAWEKNAVEPPAIIEDPSAGSVDTSATNLNVGLAPPLITELLPNPTGTGTDATDEYIELYNSNDATFNLAGFTLQTGLSTTHSWVMPQGATIPAKGFKAFYATETGLSMSNTSGQATLFDVAGNKVAQSDPYDSAPDGQAWALANGVWYWTTKPTAGSTNVIATPIAKPATAAKKLSSSTKTAGKVKAATTKKASTKKTSAEPAVTSSSTLPAAARAALHPLVLASVAIAAIGYGVYEYRHDLANAFYRLRKH